MAFINKCEKSKLMPQPCGIVARKGPIKELNIKNYSVGKEYGLALGKGLRHSVVEKLNVAANRLQAKGGISLLKNLNPQMKNINLSNNDLGENDECMHLLADIILDRRYSLETIILDNNGITDLQIGILADALLTSGNRTIKKLSLAGNCITDHGAALLADTFEMNSNEIRDLNLHWNRIKAKGGLSIARSLVDNKSLRVLDLGWNSLGSGTQIAAKQVGLIWGESLAKNKNLIHLDLSNNNF